MGKSSKASGRKSAIDQGQDQAATVTASALQPQRSTLLG